MSGKNHFFDSKMQRGISDFRKHYWTSNPYNFEIRPDSQIPIAPSLSVINYLLGYLPTLSREFFLKTRWSDKVKNSFNLIYYWVGIWGTYTNMYQLLTTEIQWQTELRTRSRLCHFSWNLHIYNCNTTLINCISVA